MDIQCNTYNAQFEYMDVLLLTIKNFIIIIFKRKKKVLNNFHERWNSQEF